MSFYTGTQCELLYAMPAKGTAVTAAASTVMSQANAGTAAGGAYQLPANFFAQQSGNGPGKSLLLKGGGYASVGGTADTLTLTWNLDTTAGTALAGGLLAGTGAMTPVISVSYLWEFEIMVTATATGVSAGVLQTIGHLSIGQCATPNAQAPTIGTWAAASSMNTIAIGGVNAGLASVNTQQAYFVEAFAAWSATTGAPSITMSNFYIFGLN